MALRLFRSAVVAVDAFRVEYEGPETGDEVSIKWETEAKWSIGKVLEWDGEKREHNIRYNHEDDEHAVDVSASLASGHWKFLEKEGAPHLPAQNLTGSEFRERLIGKLVRVYWEPYVAWHDGKVGQCDVGKRGIGLCTVTFETMGQHQYNFSDPGLGWRAKFKPDPEAWRFPADPAFHGAPNFMEVASLTLTHDHPTHHILAPRWTWTPVWWPRHGHGMRRKFWATSATMR